MKKSTREIVEALRSKGFTYKQIANKLGVSESVVGYHLNENTRKSCKLRAIKWKKKHPEVNKKIRSKYMHSVKGRNAVARSWIKKYLKDGFVTKEEVFEIIKDLGC